MKNIGVVIRGTSPVLVDNPNAEFDYKRDIEEQGKKIIKVRGDRSGTPIEYSLWRNKEGVFVPFEWIDRCIKNAAKTVKEPGKRGGSYYKSVSACMAIMPEEIPIAKTWENKPENILRRSLRRKDGNRITKENPMFEKWELSFNIALTDGFNPEVIKGILEIGGNTIGIGAWTPRCGGRFGKFEIVKFK